MKKEFFRRFVISTALMLMALSVTAGLGIWQYTVAYRNNVVSLVAEKPAVALAEVSTIGEYLFEASYGQAVRVTGDLDCSDSVIIDFDGNRDAWQVCRIDLTDGTSLAAAFAKAPNGSYQSVDLTGRIQPAHSVDAMPARYIAEPAVSAINTDDLVLRWQKTTHDGYLFLQQSIDLPGAEYLSEDLIEWPPVGIQMRNLFYAWQWWIFAAFTLFIWAKFTLDDYRALLQNRDRNEL